MSGEKLRLLAECLELNFITAEDRKGWVTDLRVLAKDLDRSVLVETLPQEAEQGPEGVGD